MSYYSGRLGQHVPNISRTLRIRGTPCTSKYLKCATRHLKIFQNTQHIISKSFKCAAHLKIFNDTHARTWSLNILKWCVARLKHFEVVCDAFQIFCSCYPNGPPYLNVFFRVARTFYRVACCICRISECVKENKFYLDLLFQWPSILCFRIRLDDGE